MKTQEKTVAWMYSIVHALVEIVCFSILYNKNGLGISIWVAILYDYFAFVPQAIIGELNHRFRKIDIGSIGVVCMSIGIWISAISNRTIAFSGICILALGNALLHEAGAIATTTCSNGKLFPSALFVAGGSFGLIIGQIIGTMGVSRKFLLVLMIIIEVIVLLTNKYWLKEMDIPEFRIINEKYGKWTIIMTAFGVTAVRSFLGYAIPISWKKELWQAVLMFFVMGAGKAAGGYLADKLGVKKVAVFASVFSIPFLLIGNKIMIVSIIGIFMFSLTMSITFGMLLSVINGNPGLAFGVTTVALFVGVLPVLLFGTFGIELNRILIIVLSLGCAFYLNKTLK